MRLNVILAFQRGVQSGWTNEASEQVGAREYGLFTCRGRRLLRTAIPALAPELFGVLYFQANGAEARWLAVRDDEPLIGKDGWIEGDSAWVAAVSAAVASLPHSTKLRFLPDFRV